MAPFEHIKGYERKKRELINILDTMNNFEKFSKLGAYVPKNLLFLGAPGIGKTTFAKDFIAATKRKCFTIRKNKPNGEFVKHIKNTFQKAKAYNNSIVFLDDMDMYANNDSKHKNAEEYITIQSCLDEVCDSNVFVVATATSQYHVPDSLLRPGRFDKQITIGFPKRQDTEKIVEYYLRKNKHFKNIRYKEVASLVVGYTCAQLEEAFNEAAIIAATNDKDFIENEDIIKACLKTFHDFKDDQQMDEEVKEARAASVAGRIAISELVGHQVMLSTLTFNRNEIGSQKYKKIKTLKLIKVNEETLDRIKIFLAPKAAFEVFRQEFNVFVPGVISLAYQHAFKLCADTAHFDFADCEINDESSNQLKSKIDSQAKSIMTQQYQEVKRMLLEYKDFYQDIYNILMEKEYITYLDIEPMKEKYNIA